MFKIINEKKLRSSFYIVRNVKSRYWTMPIANFLNNVLSSLVVRLARYP